ncbi:GAF domain-containing protein [Sulfitobacter sabulilitoris]|uniref:GAF domain-containing protein n=1 Tax=Sulfitobacter sabulilitoris TaxID=2562655 RepID=UPI00147916E9|nr:GAF domain-containing protein [Sulfitobacter sabulilitoris]
MINVADRIETAPTLERLVKATNDVLGAVGVLVTRVTNTRQIVLANSGIALPATLASWQPLSHSICQHAVAMDFPLAIDDTITHPLLQGNSAFSDLRVAAYLGAPVHDRRGKATGAICALEVRQRRWTQENIDTIRQAAAVADRLIQRA